MSNTAGVKQVKYICEQCGQAITLNIDVATHRNRKELVQKGLATYIDVHADKNGKRHGIRLAIDNDFNVRTNSIIQIKEKKVADEFEFLPSPKMKITSLSTKYNWDTWSFLELEIKSEGLEFLLESNADTNSQKIPSNMIQNRVVTTSELGNVVCTVDAIVPENSPEIFEYISHWLDAFVNSLELSSNIHVDLIPEILRFIDHHVHHEIYYTDQLVLAILIDKDSILIPNERIMSYLTRYAPGLPLIGLYPSRFTSIVKKLMNEKQFVMDDIQKILEEDLDKGQELEEEFIVMALFYLITFDALDYKLSYLNFGLEV